MTEPDEFSIYPPGYLYNTKLPSWWKETKEGKEILAQLAQCQERLAVAESIINEFAGLFDGDLYT